MNYRIFSSMNQFHQPFQLISSTQKLQAQKFKLRKAAQNTFVLKSFLQMSVQLTVSISTAFY